MELWHAPEKSLVALEPHNTYTSVRARYYERDHAYFCRSRPTRRGHAQRLHLIDDDAIFSRKAKLKTADS